MKRNPKETRLNKEQEEAIKHKTGPLLIIAGAGTGKTTVITERIKYLILGKFAKPSEVLALTFTEKAAREMESRVDVAMPYGYTQMWISTFHSFCDRILRQEALQIGLNPRYTLLSDATATQLLRDNLFKLKLDYYRPLGNPNKFIEGMLQHFSRLQDEDISPEDYLKWVDKNKEKLDKDDYKKYKELAGAYKAYDELKIAKGFMDFGDLIVKTLKLFKERKNVLREYQKKFKYILIDEFQDTNFAQNSLAILLAGDDKNITVCGDDDQSIYRFRGAAVSNIIEFRKHFPKAKIVVLTKNYRSTQEILDRSYTLIQNNNPDRLEAVEKINKRLVSQVAKDGEKAIFIHTKRVENEADTVAKKIKDLSDEGYEYKDFAILVRANDHAEPFSRALNRNGIPVQFLGPGKLFKQPEIIDLISYLKVINNFDDSVALYRILGNDFFDISSRDLAALGNFAKRKNLSLFEACEKVNEIYVTQDSKDKVTKLLEVIKKHIADAKKETAGQILYNYLEDTGLLQKLMSPDSPHAERIASNISKFFDKLKSYEVDHDDATVPVVVDYLELSSEMGESPLAADTDWTEVNAVNILTVHSSKGLEFPVVFLINLVGERFPSRQRSEQIPIPESLIKEILPIGDYHIQEERRLFYVGMTRAKEKLYLTASDYYGEAKREKKLSPFIFEALGDDVGLKEYSESGTQLSFLDYKPLGVEIEEEPRKIKIDYLSYSQIETFNICPLHYKLKYIYGLPTPQTASQSFGTTIHLTMKEFYERVIAGEKPTDKLIHQIFEKNWIDDGYLSKSHKEKFFDKGLMYLTGYLKEGYDVKVKTVAMEQMFNVPLLPSNKKGRSIRIGGKIDRVDICPDGSIEIVDYKTGATIPTQKEVDQNLQLSFYALAATKIMEKPFGVTPDKIKLSLYFLDEQEKITTIRTKEDLLKAEEEIFKVRDEIEKSNFKCSGHIFCRNCEYNLFCREID